MFFEIWRRKAGCVTLMLALVLMTGWINSLFRSDRIILKRYGFVTEYLASEEGSLGWQKEIGFNLLSGRILTDVPYWELYGFKYGQKFVPPPSLIVKRTFRMIPYWSIVIPLTTLSAYFLFSKPRKSIPKKTFEPAGTKET